MKIVWLCKQKYMSHDVLHDRFGRLFKLPEELSLLGHEVIGFCLNYSSRNVSTSPGTLSKSLSCNVKWHSQSAGFMGSNLAGYVKFLTMKIADIKPDVIVGSSDCIHSMITCWVAHKNNTPYVIDLYDNYESFGLSKVPGMVMGHRYALKRASGIITISDSLRKHLQPFIPHIPIETINSTISAGSFFPMDKEAARAILGLPQDKILIGTAGSLSADRGTKLLYQVSKLIREKYSEAHLVLAGPDHGNPPPDLPFIHYLGKIPHEDVAILFNALDIAIICMEPDDFGSFAFPQKAYEILSCKTPLVAAAVGPLKDLLGDYVQSLYKARDLKDLRDKILYQIKHKTVVDLPIPTWKDQAIKLETFLDEKVLAEND